MYLVYSDKLNSANAVVRPQLAEMVKIMDSDDCVVEKYTWAECSELSKKVDLDGMRSIYSGDGQIRYINFGTLLRGRFTTSKDTFFINNKAEMHIKIDNQVLRLYDRNDNCILDLLFVNSYKLHTLCFGFAEKVDKYYRVLFRVLMFTDNVLELQSFFHVWCLLDKDRLIGIEKVESRSRIEKYTIHPDYRLEDGIRARLSIL